jgi:alpha-1,6-mannosyltransferase
LKTLFALWAGLTYLCLVLFSHSNSANDLTLFYLIMGAAYFAVFSLFAYLYKQHEDLNARFVLIWAILFHVIGVFGVPLFEDDYYRYLWDAYHTIEFGSPYGIAPSVYFESESLALDPLGKTIPANFQAILNGINHPDTPTIYGPTVQYSFLLAYFIAPGEIWPIQALYSAVDLALIVLLLRMAPAKYVMLYAWSPLVFKEVILTAHPDGFGVFFLMFALFCFCRRAFYWMAICLALSVAAKIFSILFVPFLLFRRNWKVVTVFITVLLFLYLPLINENGSDLLGLGAMAESWEFNSAIYGLLTLFFPAYISKVILAFFLVAGFAVYFFRFHFYQAQGGGHKKGIWQIAKPIEVVPRGDIMMGAFLICAPVINAWYLVWMLPFAVIYFSATAWFASIIIMMAYMVGLNLDGFVLLDAYQHPSWVRPIEFGLIVLVLVVELIVRYRQKIFFLDKKIPDLS